MTKLDDLKKQIEEEQKRKQQQLREKDRQSYESIDMDAVDKIVNTMKKKYAEEGLELTPQNSEVKGKLGELRGIIAEDKYAKVQIQKVEELGEFHSPLVRGLGKFYLALQGILNPIKGIVSNFGLVKGLNYSLYSANMKYSAQQYLALAISGAVIAFIFAGIGTFAALGLLGRVKPFFLVLLPIVVAIIVAFFILFIILMIPKSNAKKRADLISAELPFALRHMATELKAGIGLYKTLQAIASADYGVLSEEFARTINEVEEGTDTKDALHNFAIRTESKALRDALLHIVRALKTGGNLSEIMNSIAGDVSFEMRMKVRDFAEKMNFFGVIFVVGAIVMPVFIAILGGITNAPMQIGVPISPLLILLFFCPVMPMILALLVYYIKISQPRV
jgi:flagellar protein FlaJ